MKHRLMRLGALAGTVVVAVVMVGAFARTVDAQGATGGIPQVLAALSALQDDVNELLSPSVTNVRITPALSAGAGEVVTCKVANVSDHSLHIRMDVVFLTFSSSPGSASFPSEVVVPAQAIQRFFINAGEPLSAYCMFRVQDGSAGDIRADVSVSNNTTLDRVVATAE